MPQVMPMAQQAAMAAERVHDVLEAVLMDNQICEAEVAELRTVVAENYLQASRAHDAYMIGMAALKGGYCDRVKQLIRGLPTSRT